MWQAKTQESNGTAPKASRVRRRKAFMARATARPPSSCSSSNPQAVPLSIPKATGPAPASATPTAGASGYKTASKAVVTGTEPAAPAASTEKDDDYVNIRVPREKLAPVDTGRTEMVQHRVSQSAGPQNAAPVLQSVPAQLPAPASQQWFATPAPFRTRVSRFCSLAGLAIRAWIRWTPNRSWRH